MPHGTAWHGILQVCAMSHDTTWHDILQVCTMSHDTTWHDTLQVCALSPVVSKILICSCFLFPPFRIGQELMEAQSGGPTISFAAPSQSMGQVYNPYVIEMIDKSAASLAGITVVLTYHSKVSITGPMTHTSKSMEVCWPKAVSIWSLHAAPW